jgi:hypothetical protein
LFVLTDHDADGKTYGTTVKERVTPPSWGEVPDSLDALNLDGLWPPVLFINKAQYTAAYVHWSEYKRDFTSPINEPTWHKFGVPVIRLDDVHDAVAVNLIEDFLKPTLQVSGRDCFLMEHCWLEILPPAAGFESP